MITETKKTTTESLKFDESYLYSVRG